MATKRKFCPKPRKSKKIRLEIPEETLTKLASGSFSTVFVEKFDANISKTQLSLDLFVGDNLE